MQNKNLGSQKLVGRAATLMVLVGSVLLNANCTTFQGIGDYKPVLKETSLARNPALVNEATSPNVTLNGERHTAAPEAFTFEWPVEDARFVRGFAYGPKAHWGLDLANHRGTHILSAERGTVIYTGTGFHGYGKLVVVEHSNEWATLYAHMDKINVKEGQKVERGQQLGLMGRTGHASGVHLHFEMRHFRQPVNPLAYLPETRAIIQASNRR